MDKDNDERSGGKVKERLKVPGHEMYWNFLICMDRS